MGYHACFWDILTNITHEIRDKTTYYHPLGLVSDYGGLSYHFMSKLYSNISKPSMVTPHLLCMDETNVLPGIFLEIFKKMTSLLFFVVTHLNCIWPTVACHQQPRPLTYGLLCIRRPHVAVGDKRLWFGHNIATLLLCEEPPAATIMGINPEAVKWGDEHYDRPLCPGLQPGPPSQTLGGLGQR